jgi:hypothetical protein
MTVDNPREIRFRWRCEDESDKRDAEAAEAERLLDEGKQALSISWDDDGKTIEHETTPEPSSKD